MTIHNDVAATQRQGFTERVEVEELRLRELLGRLYGGDPRLAETLRGLLGDVREAWYSRPDELKELDEQRQRDPRWFESTRILAGVCYVDLYAGTFADLIERIPYFEELGLTVLHLMPVYDAPEPNSDGGYAVSSYRATKPALGSIEQLRDLATKLREAGISLALDFVFNHTSDEHEWAQRALEGDPEYEDYYWIYPDREMPDAFERTTREIFPDNHPGNFVPVQGDRWAWATFHSFQLDLNYSNPRVFRAMAREMLFLANLGVEILRMDAVAFIWKRLGTSSENLPEAHLLLQAFNAVVRMVAPGVLFLSEAIVHPDDVVDYISPDECQLSYNPLQMALLWSTLATRDVGLLSQALAHRHALPSGTAWVNYLRSHDDIGWTFADEDARQLGIDPDAHRQFLNRFYVGRFEGSFAHGTPFQTNPKTGDSRVSGATASLAGIEVDPEGAIRRILLAQSIVLSTVGIPLLYLGDEVGQTNDSSYLEDPGKAADSRWSGRPPYPGARYAERHDLASASGRIYAGVRWLLAVRAELPAMAGGALVPFETHDSRVLGFMRPGGGVGAGAASVLVLANFGDDAATVSALTLSGMPASAIDAVSGETYDLRQPLVLGPQRFVWLLV
ncbi:alpha-amylase family protein [Frondihabitans sp. VKM Ac-2883]|uniref:alpha-amylase family protein n=1 Tax=Frondihabitans sp. VKM Ac-2883 TaxID=2783823 RepID=UPI00188A483B|nr:alpha-amylase family protein [Frondihabitans sp. VKM Ac-2883]MBF4577172.1 alpha-amylase family protein [Frondihabitans sp. VKM Ac-2883]